MRFLILVLTRQWEHFSLYETTFKKLELDLSCATLYFVGWVDLLQALLGFVALNPTYILPLL
jgi:hypothetical protein